MNKVKIANGGINASEISMGCMRLSNLSEAEASELIYSALDQGINFFDHADIYGGGRSEEIFSQAIGMSPAIRDRIFIQTKCGICEGYYDFSKEHILDSVDNSLKRLNTEYIDVLLLHRPDTLMEPEEVSEAFEALERSGKVRYFGVSNHNPMQIELLSKYLKSRIVINQLQFSIMHTGIIDSGLNVNMKKNESIDRDGSVLEYCRLKDITIQTWSPLQYGFFDGTFLDNDKFPELNCKMDEIAAQKGVSKTTLAIAWILRHPAGMQAVVGTTNTARLKEICKASQVALTRQEWYEIYIAAGNELP